MSIVIIEKTEGKFRSNIINNEKKETVKRKEEKEKTQESMFTVTVLFRRFCKTIEMLLSSLRYSQSCIKAVGTVLML